MGDSGPASDEEEGSPEEYSDYDESVDSYSELDGHCDCGCTQPAPHLNHHNYNACTLHGFRNSVSFPSLQNLTDADDPSLYYYSLSASAFYPRRNWCLVGEIVSANLGGARPTTQIHTRFGEEVPVEFTHDRAQQPTTFAWSDLRPGSTLLLAFADKHTFFDSHDGVVSQENLNFVFVVPAGQEAVLQASDRLAFAEAAWRASHQPDSLEDRPVSHSTPACCWCCGKAPGEGTSTAPAGGAGLTGATLASPAAASEAGVSLKKCAKCQLAKYCSRECQAADWGPAGQHKQLCKHTRMMQSIMTWMQTPVQEFKLWE